MHAFWKLGGNCTASVMVQLYGACHIQTQSTKILQHIKRQIMKK